jgi:cytochrome c oxidase subunit 2
MAGLWRWLFTLLILAACVSCAPKNEGGKDSNMEVPQDQPIGSADEGKPFYTTCKACHGDAGQGNLQLRAPAIANLDSWYIYRQLMNFKKGYAGIPP